MARVALSSTLAISLYIVVAAQGIRAPKIWDDAALADWATPVAG